MELVAVWDFCICITTPPVVHLAVTLKAFEGHKTNLSLQKRKNEILFLFKSCKLFF